MPRDLFEAEVSQSLEIAELGREILICFQDIDGPCEISTCYGDICKIVNALRDYSRLLEMVCDQWELQGWQRAVYEYHARKLREISQKYQAGIHYDYDAAVEKCRKKREKQQREDDVGGEAIELAVRRSYRKGDKKQVSEAATAFDEASDEGSPWDEGSLE